MVSKYIREMHILHEVVGHYVTIGEDYSGGVRLAQYEKDGTLAGDLCFDREQAVEVAKAILDMYEVEVLFDGINE